MLSLLEITRKGGCGASPNGLLMECDDESSQLTVYLTFFRELSKSGNHMGDVLLIKKAAFLPPPTHEIFLLSKGRRFSNFF